MPRVSISELAEEFHMPRSRALQHLKDAGLSRASDKTFDYDEARAALTLRQDEEAIAGNIAAGRRTSIGNSLDDEARRALNRSKSESEAERARKLKLTNDKLEGRLVDREAVVKAGQHFAATVRASLLSFGSKLAPQLAGVTDEREIRTAIDREIRQALARLADPDLFALGLLDENTS